MLSEERIKNIKCIENMKGRIGFAELYDYAEYAIIDLLAERKELLARINELEVIADSLLDPPVMKLKPKSIEDFILSRQKD